MATDFLHGVQVVNIDSGARPISVPATSVIGVVGTAPGADPEAFPEDTPVLVTSLTEAAKLGELTGDSEKDGTLPGALSGIYKQAGAVVVVIRVKAGENATQTMAAVIGGVNSANGTYMGVHALLAAESVVGVKPRILIAPGFTHQRPEDAANSGATLANPVTAELKGIAKRLRAIIVKDGPNTNDATALADAKDGGERVYCVDPFVIASIGGESRAVPNSSYVAGAIARSDSERGWWASPSNFEIFGITGTARPIDFALSDPACRANLLNAGNVTTIIRQNGFRLWGNRTQGVDPKWQFLCVLRTSDIIADALERSHMWAVDMGITKTYAEDVREGVLSFLRGLVAQGAILGGDCWVDPELNTANNIKQGKFYWDFEFTPTYPGEQLTFRAHMTDRYISEIF